MQLSQELRSYKWEDLFGHDKIKTEWQKRFKDDSIPQAVYIVGQTGVGKTTFSRLIGMRAACENPKGADPCCKCEECLEVINETWNRSVREINASNLNVEDVRALDEDSRNRSFYGTKKVYIINELQEAYANKKATKNMLEVLEIKNKNAIIILTSMDDAKVDKAIKGRCIQYKLKPFTSVEIAKFLKTVCEKKSIQIDTDAKAATLITLAENAGGSLRDALGYLERVVLGDLWTAEEIRTELNLTSQSEIKDLLQKILKKDMSVFETKIEVEMIHQFRFLLTLLIKQQMKAKLSWYESKCIEGLAFPIEILFPVSAVFEDLFLRPYIDQPSIDRAICEAIWQITPITFADQTTQVRRRAGVRV